MTNNRTSMLYLTSFLLFLLFYIPSSIQTNTDEAKEIVFNLDINEYGVPSIQLSLGTPPRKYKFFISTIISRLYIAESEDGYIPSLSSTFENDEGGLIELPDLGRDVKGKKVRDTLSFNNNYQMTKFPFVLLKKGDVNYYYKGSLGLEYQSVTDEDDDFSFINNLYRKNIINFFIFYIQHDKRDNTKKLIFGTAPINSFITRKFKTCKLRKRDKIGNLNISWQCFLNSVYFDDNSLYTVEQPISFSIGGNIMCVNKEIYDVVKKKYFSQAISSGTCWEKEESNRHFIKCQNEFSLNEDAYIALVFGKWNIKLNINSLFLSTSNKQLQIMNCENTNHPWSLGYNILGISTLVFDKENGMLWLSNN